MSAMPNESCLYILCYAYTFGSLVFMDTVDAHHRVSEDYSIIKAATFVYIHATDSSANTIQLGHVGPTTIRLVFAKLWPFVICLLTQCLNCKNFI